MQEFGPQESGMQNFGTQEPGTEHVVVFATESRETANRDAQTGETTSPMAGAPERENAEARNPAPHAGTHAAAQAGMPRDDTSRNRSAAAGAGRPQQDPVVAYCQQCGTGLTAHSLRQVGSGIFCERCALLRQAQDGGWAPVPSIDPTSPDAPIATEPNPALAGWLGLIPGVGAMFNGQYAKSIVHLVVFVILLSLGDNLNWVFYWFVWGWIFYQAFEAYHTALARRNGLPLPNPFGLNDLTERFGFLPTAAAPREKTRPVPPPSASAYPSATDPFPSQTTSPYPSPTGAPFPPVSFNSSPYEPRTASTPFASAPGFSNAAGYAPPSVPPQAGPAGSAQAGAPFGAGSYTPTFTGTSSFSGPAAAPLSSLSRTARFPGAAVWLIGLGAIFLLGNIWPTWRLEGRWLVPTLLTGIALWIGSRRVVALQNAEPAFALSGARPDWAGVLLGPILLLTVAVLLALQDAHAIPLRHSWPALLIVWGALLLFSRARSLGPEAYVATAATAARPATTGPVTTEPATTAATVEQPPQR